MAKKKDAQHEEFGDIVQNHELVKRTLMVAGFPAMVREYIKNGSVCYAGFLPGFEFCEVEDIEDFGELMETLQDMLDDEVEELVVFGEQLPNVPEDEKLMEIYPGHEIKYLDINVYAEKDEMCTHDCSTCGGCSYTTDGNEDYDFGEGFEYDDECDDEECDCHHHHCDCGHDHECDDEDCDCGHDHE